MYKLIPVKFYVLSSLVVHQCSSRLEVLAITGNISLLFFSVCEPKISLQRTYDYSHLLRHHIERHLKRATFKILDIFKDFAATLSRPESWGTVEKIDDFPFQQILKSRRLQNSQPTSSMAINCDAATDYTQRSKWLLWMMILQITASWSQTARPLHHMFICQWL